MLRKDFIQCKTRELLNEFMAPITAKADKPRQKSCDIRLPEQYYCQVLWL